MSDTQPTPEELARMEFMDATAFLRNAPAVAELSKQLEKALAQLETTYQQRYEEYEWACAARDVASIAVKRMERLINALNHFLLEDTDDGEPPL